MHPVSSDTLQGSLTGQRYFISGIGTGVGKTILSAILVEKLQADYWKPVQTGALSDSDSMTVKALISNPVSMMHPEKFRFNLAASPHEAAAEENQRIALSDLMDPLLPLNKTVIIEGAGGLLVPLNDREMMFELISKLKAELILVSMNYLGSINHTLLSLDLIKNKNIPFKGLVFTGSPNKASEDVILAYSKAPLLGHVPWLPVVDQNTVAKVAWEIRFKL